MPDSVCLVVSVRSFVHLVVSVHSVVPGHLVASATEGSWIVTDGLLRVWVAGLFVAARVA